MHPELNVFDEAIMKFFPPSPPLDCKSKSNPEVWVHMRKDVAVVDQDLVRKRGISCNFAGEFWFLTVCGAALRLEISGLTRSFELL
jgi:hypothetical protein